MMTTSDPKVELPPGILHSAVVDVALRKYYRQTIPPPMSDHPDNVPVLTEKLEQPILNPFVSFADTGDKMLQLVSGLHTSRVSAYGFTAEADVLGVDRYAISEQLDNRACPVCRAMHGRTFNVNRARATLETIFNVEDPDELRYLQPWPSQDQENVEAMKNMSEAELTSRNWHIPPYHPYCRGLLVHVTKVPSLNRHTVFDQQTIALDLERVTEENFAEYGMQADEKMVRFWNTHIATSVGDAISRLSGVAPLKLLDQARDKKILGIGLRNYLRNDPEGLEVQTLEIEKKAFGSLYPIKAAVDYIPFRSSAVVTMLEVHPIDISRGVRARLIRSWREFFGDLGVSDLMFDVPIN